MGTDERVMYTPNQWRWPQEPECTQTVQGAATARTQFRALSLPRGVVDNEELRRNVLARPDDDAPRQAYATWMAAQDHEFAQTISAFVMAQLRVAQAFRANPRADVGMLRSWRGDTAFVSTADFRAGDSLRPWFLDGFRTLISQGLVGWPQVYRGFVERVGVRALRFLELAEELFRLAPIRHLVVIGVPEVVDELAACPHLDRIRSLSLTRYGREDDLTDDTLQRLIASPHLGNLAHLRLVNQPQLTRRVYEDVVTAPTLPGLSSFEVYEPVVSWSHQEPAIYDPRGRAERMIVFDTPIPARRSKDWIAGLERNIGYEPCVHPEDHYGRDVVDIEAIVEHPIAFDARIMARRGLAVSGLPLAKAQPQ
jgi:uncharacterized protein (TIGR02996 family)